MPVNKKQTSKRVAHLASGLLKSRSATKKVKSVAGSAESQAPLHKKTTKRKVTKRK